MAEKPPHIAILPTPGMGHLIPLIELAKRLVTHHGFTVTFIIPNDNSSLKAQKAVLQSLPPSIDSIFLPPVSFDDLPAETKIETMISLTVVRSLSHLRSSLELLVSKTRVAALVVDLFGTDAFDVAAEFGVAPYIFYPSTAMALSLFLFLPKLDEMVACEFRDMNEPVAIPGCVPIHGSQLLDPVQDRRNDAYKWVLHHTKRYRLAEGIMVNSFMELEPGPLKALQTPEPGKPPVYPVGPLIKRASEMGSGENECLKWLDDQPLGSVLFVAFGSGGTLPSEQLDELALGLEMSEQRFLWVVRSPSRVADSSFFSVHSQNDPFSFLPQGFVDRTKGRGLLVSSWAPQAQIISHASTGGFLSHCGWNSTLESVACGVPMIAWPLYAEQKMNAITLTDDLKVALRPKVNENGLIDRNEIARIVKGLMEGEEGKDVRSRMKDLKDASAKVLSHDGSSTKALATVAQKWKAHKNY
ncbi:hydroquinone glucosyltransferase-like [Vitis riparia]|uniref:hydroquinone glucosyltransferase-like n=1 Tax=Vitis riparia TaxID=96939 RepID=UPI00155AF14C|nr:hydroquinone glucosyltransferase-like [Vitis riparia]